MKEGIMDPYRLIGWILALILLMLILTPAVSIFNITLRRWIKSTKKTIKTYHN